MDGQGWKYTDTVKEHFMNPKNILEVSEEEYHADGVGFVGSPACGDMMKIYIKVKDDKIIDLKWKTFGCASAIGSTSKMSEMVMQNGGMTLDEAYKITPDLIIKELGGLPANKIHCSVLGDKALQDAIKDYYQKTGQLDKIAPDTTKVICHCLNVTDDDIKMEVLEGVKDFATLQERTKIGTGCGKCVGNATKILEEYVAKYYKDDVYTGDK